MDRKTAIKCMGEMIMQGYGHNEVTPLLIKKTNEYGIGYTWGLEYKQIWDIKDLPYDVTIEPDE